MWVRADGLLWWLKGNQTPPLVTTSPANAPRAQAGVLGQPGTTVLHGGDKLDDNIRFGVMFNAGWWFNDCTAVELTYLTLGDGDNTGGWIGQANGIPIIARPFFNTQRNAQEAVRISFPGAFNGQLRITTASDLRSLSGLVRRTLRRGPKGRIDGLVGYRHFRFQEGLVFQQSTTLTNFPIANRPQINVTEGFFTRSSFHGGEFGLNGVFDRGCWSFDVLGKLAIGSMRQTQTIAGQTTVVVPNFGQATSQGGLLAQPTNIGTRSRDEFAFLPELHLGVGYQVRSNLKVTGGYSLMFATNVLRTGDQIDLTVNPTQLSGGTLVGPARPAAQIRDTALWAQGLRLGVEINR